MRFIRATLSVAELGAAPAVFLIVPAGIPDVTECNEKLVRISWNQDLDKLSLKLCTYFIFKTE